MTPPFVWCPVANMRDERRAGPGGCDLWHGTKHFCPGAKLYCWPFYWDRGSGRIRVLGKHRHSPRYITIVVRAAWLTNWRVKAIYDPSIIRKLMPCGELAGCVWDESEQSRTEAEDFVAWVRRYLDPDTAIGRPFIRSA